MKRIALAAAVLPFLFVGAYAQGIHIGPGGVDVSTGMGGQDHVVREYQDGDGCMVRVIRHRNDEGDMVTRKIRHCD